MKAKPLNNVRYILDQILPGIILVVLWLLPAPVMAGGEPLAPDSERQQQALFDQGLTHYRSGRHVQAAQAWEKLRAWPNDQKSEGLHLDTLMHLAFVYQALGRHKVALDGLLEGLPGARKTADEARRALYLSTLGDVYLSLGKGETAAEHLEAALAAARKADNPEVLAGVLNNLGNLMAADGDLEAAMDLYGESLALGDQLNPDTGLALRVCLNLLRLDCITQNQAEAQKHLEKFRTEVEKLPPEHPKAMALMGLAGLLPDLHKEFQGLTLPQGLAPRALLEQVRNLALKENDAYLISSALGAMAMLGDESPEQAADLTRRALLFAQQGGYPELIYRWQWQLARLSAALGQHERAIRAYYETLETLNPIRSEFFSGLRLPADRFNLQVKPVYLELSHLLIRQGRAMEVQADREQKLLQARDVMEMLKTAELQDFFGDECVAAVDLKKVRLDHSPPGTAVIYPIAFEDELSVLLFLPDGVREFSTKVPYAQVKETITNYRKRLQTRVNNRFLHESRQLFDWLIRPLEATLRAAKVETLIVAPDGVLRLIPVSTLHDGSRFLIEKYAISTIPAMGMVEPRPFATAEPQILLSGVAEAVQDFSALPSVPKELEDIQQIMNGKVRLLNKEHTVENLTTQLQQHSFSIVHLATHGVFGGTPQNSFLLTYDDRLTMDRLESLILQTKFREQPVELLTLSACQTALGDERAALGLAGVAIKAGVRSAVATLWYVDDEATSLAIREFYRQLRKPGITKAQALQNAQKSLINEDRYWHPLYWAPFLLIGNWM